MVAAVLSAASPSSDLSDNYRTTSGSNRVLAQNFVASCHEIPAVQIEFRGTHTGECEVAGSKVSGIAVHTGARVAAAARPQEVVVSWTVRDLVAGSGIRFDDRGSYVLKGVPADVRLFAITST